MSNKIVPTVYRAIIDDVIANVAVDFEEYGMDDDVLQILQAKWESKLLETRVADFARAPGASSSSSPEPKASQGGAPTASSPAGPSNPPQPAYGLSFPAPGHGLALPGQSSSNFANSPGQQYNGLPAMGQGNMGHAGQGGNMGMMNGGGNYGSEVKSDPDDMLRLRGGAYDDDEKDVKPYIKPEPNAAGLLPGDEVIDSDLDDSDDELRDDGDEDGGADVDIVFCVYDKVQRVKNKWKTVLKDGMIHINGRDYLFAKCNGEFEW
ncbi:putative general RNA polymerase II transcription factor [Papiliotrema laurentii]|uniref:Transcription initiation factor IIA large subunit n=1 Tax=Papiliotrema laurentii TaxID=5418 RepID=A0AAD9FSW6_PAPLA|nr:putative general RNA polymerase II transcription factor [Papiliotrema laurentii]